MTNTTLGSLILQGDGKCFIGDISVRKEANLTPMPLYTQDAEDTDVFDFGGVVKSITVSGIFIGTDIADCATFITNFESVIQGQQDSETGYPLTFHDDYRGDLKVKISEFQSDTTNGEPLIVRWSFKFFNSSQNG